MEYNGSDLNSGLENCELIYQIPSDAVLNNGDTVAFEVTDENGNVLAHDNTETQPYANVNIEYKFEDGSEIPNAPKAVIPLAVGSYVNWTAAPSLYGYTLSRVEGLNQIVSGSGQTVTYYYNYAIATYNISVTDCVAKKGEDTVGQAHYGDIIKVTANPAPTGKVFDKWVITGLDTTDMDLTKTEITFNMPANAVEIKATYSEVKYNVSVTGGTGGGVYVEGTSVTITADAPMAGKRFTGWTIEGISGLDTTQTSLNFNMPAGNVTAIANYEDIEYAVTVNGGTTDKAKAKYGDTVTITANSPATGKRFKGWTIEGVSGLDTTQASITFNMPNGNVTATANYEDIEYTVTVTGGTVDKAKAKYSETVTVTANAPATGKRFTDWTIEGVSGLDTTQASITFNMPNGNVTATANYEDIEYTVTVNGGTTDKAKAKYGETVTITATVPTGKEFVKWSCTGISLPAAELEKEEITFTMPDNDVTLTATAKYQEEVTITANPAPTGKVFDKWTCETAGITIEFESATSSPTTFVMPAAEVEIKAHFRVEGTAPSVEVKVEGGKGGGTYQKGESVTVTANEPEEGKVFAGWKDASGKIVSTKKVYTFTVTGETTLTAVYEDKPVKKGLNGGAIAGIVIGSVVVAGLGGFAIVWFVVKKKTFADLGVAIKGVFTKKK